MLSETPLDKGDSNTQGALVTAVVVVGIGVVSALATSIDNVMVESDNDGNAIESMGCRILFGMTTIQIDGGMMVV